MNLSFSISKAIYGIIGIVILFYGVLIVVNLSVFDEDLDRAIVDVLMPIQMPADEENALIAIWGLTASSDQDIIEVGKQLFTRYRDNRDVKNLDQLTKNDYQEILGDNELDIHWQNSIESCTARMEYGCISKLAMKIETQPLTEQRLILMFKRYEQIINMPKFQQIDDHTFLTPITPYATLMHLRKLKLADAYNSVDSAVFIETVAKDLKFWKLLLNDGSTLLDNMIAIASIWGDMQAISEFIRTRDQLSLQEVQLITSIVQPLTLEELDIGDSFAFEQRAAYHWLKNMSKDKSLDSNFWVTQINATMNSNYQYSIRPFKCLSKLPPQDLINTIKLIRSSQKNLCFDKQGFEVRFSPASLYNLWGKLSFSSNISGASDYIARVHDLNGIIRLIELQMQLKLNPSNSIETSINNSELTNYYTGEPMVYDKENNWLGFECMSKGSVCKIKL